MTTAIVAVVGAALLAGAFALGRATGRARWGWLAALLPAALFVWSAVAALTEDEDECYETCGSLWLFIFSVVSIAPALVLGGAVALGAASRGRSRRDRVTR